MHRQRAGSGRRGMQPPHGGGAGRRSASRRPNATAGREGDGVARKDPREQLKVRRQEPADRLPRREPGKREEDVGVRRRVESGATNVNLNNVAVEVRLEEHQRVRSDGERVGRHSSLAEPLARVKLAHQLDRTSGVFPHSPPCICRIKIRSAMGFGTGRTVEAKRTSQFGDEV